MDDAAYFMGTFNLRVMSHHGFGFYHGLQRNTMYTFLIEYMQREMFMGIEKKNTGSSAADCACVIFFFECS